MFGRTKSRYRRGDTVHFIAGPKRVTIKGTVLAVEKDGTLGVQPSGAKSCAIMVAPDRVTHASQKGFPL